MLKISFGKKVKKITFHLKYKNERPKWTCNAVLRKRLNRSGNFWFQIESMNVLRVNYGLDFAFSPRGPCSRPFLMQKFIARKHCHLAVKKGNWLSTLSAAENLCRPITYGTYHILFGKIHEGHIDL